MRILRVLLLLWVPLVLRAAPPSDVSRKAHPVLDYALKPEDRARLEAETREVLAMSEEELLALVPAQTPFITSDCPACTNRHHSRGPDAAMWKLELPATIRCVQCGTAFPNEKYPLNHTATFFNTLGEKITLPYHRDAEGRLSALPSAVQTWQNARLTRNLEALGKLYQLTKEERYAERVTLVLDRYAQFYPHYLVKEFLTAKAGGPGARGTQRSSYVPVSTGGPWMRDGKRYAEKPSEPEASAERTNIPYGWTQSRWGWGRWGDELPSELLRAYDLVYASDAFEKLSATRGSDIRRRIEDGIFRNAVAYVHEYPFWYHVNNNASHHIAEMIHIGRVIGEPEFVHFGYRWSREVLEKYVFSREGAFAESPGYLYVFLATQEANFTALEGYSDPPGFVGQDGLHLENLGQSSAAAFLQKARAAVESLRFPNGSSLPLGDNRHDEFVDPTYRPGVRGEPRKQSENVLLPGYGHAVLGAGSGDRQVQAQLHFSHFTGVTHTHADGLSLMLWAFGTELFTDIGYHKTKYRGYASTTLSHNTVVIDREPQRGADAKGSVLLYEPNLPGIAVVQVEDRGAYEGKATRYRRTLLLNTRDLEAPYLVDVFEVRGGETRDYLLHGPTIFDSAAEASIPLKPMSDSQNPGLDHERPMLLPGEKWTDETGKCAYGVFTNVRTALPSQSFDITFRIRDPYSRPAFHPNSRYPAPASFHFAIDPAAYRDRSEIGVKSHFLRGNNFHQIFLADSPSLTRSGLEGSELTETVKRPSLIVRESGPEPSLFVVVHEPYYGVPKIVGVKRLPIAGDPESAVALQIETRDRTDVVVLSLDDQREVRIVGDDSVFMRGRAGFISTKNGQKPVAWLIGGTELQRGGMRLNSSAGSYGGVVEAVSSRWDDGSENSFVTSTPLPAGEALRGSWMMVTYGESDATDSFEIDRVETGEGKTRIVLKDDPGLRVSGKTTTEIFFPRRSFAGENRFVIYTRTVTE